LPSPDPVLPFYVVALMQYIYFKVTLFRHPQTKMYVMTEIV